MWNHGIKPTVRSRTESFVFYDYEKLERSAVVGSIPGDPMSF